MKIEMKNQPKGCNSCAHKDWLTCGRCRKKNLSGYESRAPKAKGESNLLPGLEEALRLVDSCPHFMGGEGKARGIIKMEIELRISDLTSGPKKVRIKP